MNKSNRRNFIGKGVVASAAVTAASRQFQRPRRTSLSKRCITRTVRNRIKSPYSSIITYGNMVFIAGVGCHHEAGDIKVHTKECSGHYPEDPRERWLFHGKMSQMQRVT